MGANPAELNDLQQKLARVNTEIEQKKSKNEFNKKPPGVYVTGAGYAPVNGFYVRRELTEGPPSGWEDIHGSNVSTSHWYEKDDKKGCVIFHLTRKSPIGSVTNMWLLCAKRKACDPDTLYLNFTRSRYTPPAKGWKSSKRGWRGLKCDPSPTMRVVS